VAQVCGPTLLQALLRQPWRLFSAPVQMAELHVRLHRLPTHGFPAPPDCLLGRRLDEVASAIGAYALRGLRPGLDWLCVNRPGPVRDPRILHLDFHPLNLIEDKDRSLVVLDWNEADLGDPHADVGTAVMLMDCPPPIEVTRLERLSILTGRPWFLHAYLRGYRRHLPLEKNRLSYYRALAALRRLCNYGRWLQDGPEISGNKRSLLQCITDSHRQTLEHYFQKWTGVAVRL
jgi:aminoglycoside phosphotransferase (APT) family kinase protein